MFAFSILDLLFMGNLIFIIYTISFLKLSQNIWLRVGFSKLNGHYSFSVTCVFVHQNYEKETVVVCQSTNIKKRTITKNLQQLKPKRPRYIAMKIQFLVCDGHNNVAVFNRLMKSQHWPDNRIPTTTDKQQIKTYRDSLLALKSTTHYYKHEWQLYKHKLYIIAD
jgi:hypothetical protein